MSNRRSILFFLVGIVFAVSALVLISMRSREVANINVRNSLCQFAPEKVQGMDIVRGGTNLITIVKDESGSWRLAAPFPAPAEPSAMEKIVDMLTQQPIGDMRTEAELAALGEDFADFGLEGKSTVVVTVRSSTSDAHVYLGASTSSGNEVYARVGSMRSVFTVAKSAVDVLPMNADDLRRRSILTVGAEDVQGIDFRVPGSPFVKLHRGEAGWRLLSPVEVAADGAAVMTLVEALVRARVQTFVLPSALNPPEVGETTVKSSTLAPYGLGVDAGLSVTVRSVSGATEQIVFGSSAGTNLVYALVQNGGAVVALDASLAELCKKGDASFRDTRVFPLGSGERLKSVSLSQGDLVYVLSQGTNGVWRLASPAEAPADQAVASALADAVMRMRSCDVPETKPGKGAVRVSIETDAGVRTGVEVDGRFFSDCGALANLRSKTLVEIDSATVRRITQKSEEGGEVSVRYDVERSAWVRDVAEGAAPANVDQQAVKKLLGVLAKVEAQGVETVATTPDDFRRCSLDRPLFVLAIDFDGTDSVRRNLIIGGVAGGGARYATMGGADAVFIISRDLVEALMGKVLQ